MSMNSNIPYTPRSHPFIEWLIVSAHGTDGSKKL